LDEEIVQKLSLSGLSGITLGIESFDEKILHSIGKKISVESNKNALSLLSKYGIISIGHIILGHINDTRDSIEKTIQYAIDSEMNFAQFYCAVPYPGTSLHKDAKQHDLIRVKDLTKYELCNPIMDTLNGLTHFEVGEYRKKAIKSFWTSNRWHKLNQMINRGIGADRNMQKSFLNWNQGETGSLVRSSFVMSEI
jgi:anaerobic magnesium-protoporphyrin IX monomethyl ester cyclase